MVLCEDQTVGVPAGQELADGGSGLDSIARKPVRRQGW